MKITIITPSFNQGKYIEETITSVLNQQYSDLEYLVIDGGSTDNTLTILNKHANRLKWISEKDKGQSNAINKGLRMATGDILAFLNSDDQLLPGTLNKVNEFFLKNPESKWLSGDYYIISANGKKMHNFVRFYKKILRLFSSYTLLTLVNYIIQPSTFWRRSIRNEIGLFDEKLAFEMDYDYWLRIAKKYQISFIESPLSLFRLHSASKSGYQFSKQFNEEIKVLKKYKVHPLAIFFHRMHNLIIMAIYQRVRSSKKLN